MGSVRNKAKYKKETVYPFLSRMYKLFEKRPDIFELKKLRGIYGECVYDEDKIYIDYRKIFLPTLIHEVLHYFYPDWSETKVLKEESKIVNALSVRQVQNILKRYSLFF
jgi:hypothetical protein